MFAVAWAFLWVVCTGIPPIYLRDTFSECSGSSFRPRRLAYLRSSLPVESQAGAGSFALLRLIPETMPGLVLTHSYRARTVASPFLRGAYILYSCDVASS